MSEVEVNPEDVFKIFISLIAGALIGLERELTAKAAGLRTHVLVSVGACLFTIGGQTMGVDADPARVSAQVVTGIGFLGAGAIMKAGGSVRGLTTAASLWVTAALGLSIGSGAYVAALSALVAALFTLAFMHQMEEMMLLTWRNRTTSLFLKQGASPVMAIKAARYILGPTNLMHITSTPTGIKLTVTSPLRHGDDMADLAEELLALPMVEGIEMTPY